MGRVQELSTSVRSPDELLAEFRETGSEQAFEEIVRRYAGMVFSTCLRACRNPHDAEDATQAVFLKLAAQCKTDASVRRIGPWLQQVAKRTALDVRRSKRRRETREQRHHQMNGNGNGHELHPYANGRSHEVDFDSLNQALVEELSKLPGKYRLPLISLYFGGISREEIAKELGLKPSALGVRIHRARQMLAKRLVDRGAAPAGLVLSSVLAPAAAVWFSTRMASRTAEAAAQITLGHNLSGAVSANVLAIIKNAAAAAAIGKLKVVASVVLTLALAAGGARAAERYFPGSVPLVGEVKRLLDGWEWPSFRAPRLPVPSLTDGVREPLVSAPEAVNSPAAADRPVYAVATPVVSEIPAPRQPDATPFAPVNAAVPAPPLPPIERQPVSAGPYVSAPVAPARAVNTTPAAAGASQAPRVAAAVRAGGPPSDRDAGTDRGAADRAATPPPSFARATYSASGDFSFAASSRIEPLAGLNPNSGKSGSGGGRSNPGKASNGSGNGNGKGDGPISVELPLLEVASAKDSHGSLAIGSGELHTGAQDIGRRGVAEVNQTGGVNRTTQMQLGAEPTGTATYTLAAGKVQIDPAPVATKVSNNDGGPVYSGIQVGGEGTGTFKLGNESTPGTIAFGRRQSLASTTGGNGGGAKTNALRLLNSLGPSTLEPMGPAPLGESALVVRGSENGTGTLAGWGGVIGASSTYVQNGQTVADGYNVGRKLIIVGYDSVTNTIDNPTRDGTNGWFAVRGGRLVLPPIPVAPGTAAYTWGENPADPSIDLVNSVRVTLRDVRNADRMNLHLLAADSPDAPALPAGHTFIGLWSLSTNLAMPSGIDLTVRYDDALAAELGLSENNLKLWYYDAAGWHLLLNDPSFARDVDLNLLSARAPGSPNFFAVSAPEPTGFALLALGGAALLLPRRRRG